MKTTPTSRLLGININEKRRTKREERSMCDLTYANANFRTNEQRKREREGERERKGEVR